MKIKKGLSSLAIGFLLLTAVMMGGCGSIRTAYYYYCPDWMPDGKIICVKEVRTYQENGFPAGVQTSSKWYITTMSNEGTGEVDIKEIDRKGRVAPFPNGNYIAYTDGNYIKFIDANGHNVSYIDTQAEIENISWASDGNRLIYGSNVDISSNNQIIMINADGSGKRILSYGRTPSWLSSGAANKVVFSNQNSGDITIYDLTTNVTAEIKVVGFQFDWFANGQNILYANEGIWSIAIDGSNKMKIIDRLLSFPKLSDDETKIVCGDLNDSGIWISRNDGTGLIQLK